MTNKDDTLYPPTTISKEYEVKCQAFLKENCCKHVLMETLMTNAEHLKVSLFPSQSSFSEYYGLAWKERQWGVFLCVCLYLSPVCVWHRGLKRVWRKEKTGSQQVFGAITTWIETCSWHIGSMHGGMATTNQEPSNADRSCLRPTSFSVGPQGKKELEGKLIRSRGEN